LASHLAWYQALTAAGVAAELPVVPDMWARLLSAGLSADTPTVYLLEGFIGKPVYQAVMGNIAMQLIAWAALRLLQVNIP
jgi:hypothetical protein